MNNFAELPSHEYEEVTPEKAAAWLENNQVNRPVSKQTVDKYARDIETGNWNYSMPIMFDQNQKLIDGQHRCLAMVKTGKTLVLLIIRGVPAQAQLTLDNHKARSLSDQLKIAEDMDSRYAVQLVALARNIWKAERNWVSNGTTVSTMELHNIMEDSENLEPSVQIALRAKNEKLMTPLFPSAFAIAHWLISRVNGQELADWFIDRVITMEHDDRESAIGALNFAANRIRRQGIRFHIRDQVYMLLSTWNAVAEGKSKQRQYSKGKGKQFKLPEVKKYKAQAVPPTSQAA